MAIETTSGKPPETPVADRPREPTTTDPSDRSPKYEQIYREIREELRAGYYTVGSRLPTENQLASRFGVSRDTIRRSLDRLVQSGFVQSRQGSGYQVMALSPATETCLTSFTDIVLRSGRKPGAKLVSIQTLESDELPPALVHPDLVGEKVGVITRVRTIDDDPVLLVRTYMRASDMQLARPQDFPEMGPDQSILRILQRRFHMSWCSAKETILAVPADEEAARELDIDVGSPVLLQSCTAADEAGRVVFHEVAIRHGALAIEHPSLVSETEDTLSPAR